MYENDCYATFSVFGEASAHVHRSQHGGQTVIVNFGDHVSIHVPYDQALVLRADLDVALAQFDSGSISGSAAKVVA